jgi:hypothetical protein
MLIGLGINLGVWIIYAIIFATFVTRYFREHSVSSTNPITQRVRSISIALGINIITFLVLPTTSMVLRTRFVRRIGSWSFHFCFVQGKKWMMCGFTYGMRHPHLLESWPSLFYCRMTCLMERRFVLCFDVGVVPLPKRTWNGMLPVMRPKAENLNWTMK